MVVRHARVVRVSACPWWCVLGLRGRRSDVACGRVELVPGRLDGLHSPIDAILLVDESQVEP